MAENRPEAMTEHDEVLQVDEGVAQVCTLFLPILSRMNSSQCNPDLNVR